MQLQKVRMLSIHVVDIAVQAGFTRDKKTNHTVLISWKNPLCTERWGKIWRSVQQVSIDIACVFVYINYIITTRWNHGYTSGENVANRCLFTTFTSVEKFLVANIHWYLYQKYTCNLENIYSYCHTEHNFAHFISAHAID